MAHIAACATRTTGASSTYRHGRTGPGSFLPQGRKRKVRESRSTRRHNPRGTDGTIRQGASQAHGTGRTTRKPPPGRTRSGATGGIAFGKGHREAPDEDGLGTGATARDRHPPYPARAKDPAPARAPGQSEAAARQQRNDWANDILTDVIRWREWGRHPCRPHFRLGARLPFLPPPKPERDSARRDALGRSAEVLENAPPRL